MVSQLLDFPDVKAATSVADREDLFRFVKLAKAGGNPEQIRSLLELARRQGDTDVVDPFTPVAAPVPGPGAPSGGLDEAAILELIRTGIAEAAAAAPAAGGFPAPIFTIDIEALLAPANLPEPTFETPTGGAAVGAGLQDLLAQIEVLLAANAQRQQERQTNIQLADFISQVSRADPVRAANLQFLLTGEQAGGGIEQFTRALALGEKPLSFGGLPPSVQVGVGGQNIDLLTSLTTPQRLAIEASPDLLTLFQSLEAESGLDILGQSRRAMIPGGVLPAAPI